MDIQQFRNRAWLTELPHDEFLGEAPTMLSHGERFMLHWMARYLPLSPAGTIVDAGCFLGGSTLAFATGLARSSVTPDKSYRIHSYDMFVAPNDDYSLGLISNGKRPGDTVLDLVLPRLRDYLGLVMLHSGDMMRAPPPSGPIDILFVDLAKTRKLNAKILLDFFPKLTPGRSILVQQDFNDHSCQWVNSTMEYLSPYFETLCDESSSRVYLCARAVPAEALREAALGLSYADEMALFQRLVSREENPASRYFSAVAAGWTVFENEGAEQAAAYLDNIPFPQPWEASIRYVDTVKHAMVQLRDNAGLERYHAGYFVGAKAA